MGLGLNLEQTQKLVMTPELRQAIVILQLSALELDQYIQQAMMENPVLEMNEEIPELAEEATASADEDGPGFELDWQEYFDDSTDLGVVRYPREEYEGYSWENFLAQAPTLHEYLLLQLQLAVSEGKKKEIGEFLIGNIDENGYLRVDLGEVAARFGVAEQEVEDVLRVIHGFDPPGVGARSLVECLVIQLYHLECSSGLARTIVENHLEDLGQGRLDKIARHLGVPVQEVQEAADLIKTLDPKPGRKFGTPHDVRYVVPDVVVERVDGEYVVLVNDTGMPRLGISSLYQSLLKRGLAGDEETRKFVESKFNAAAWIIRSIEQRRLTLYRVVKCIVEFQKEFLEKGIKYLKPLNLRQVAEALGMHESTVSRATANKYIQTPQGVFELKFFFAGGIPCAGGKVHCTESIKKMIAELVASEDPLKPYTDQRITELLAEKGISISRRTVAKYRDELRIPAAGKRKRY